MSTVINGSTNVNIDLSSDKPRITGDFSNATVANRVMFQTSTVNGNTLLGVVPNGTANVSAFTVLNSADPTNSATCQIQVNSGAAVINSGITGTGTYLPMTFYTGGSERMRVDTSGNVGIGVAPVALNKFIAQADTSDTTTNAIRANNSAGTPVFIVGGNGQALVLAPAGLGYGTGAGGTVTQATSKGTAVTLNKPTGQITMNNASLGAGAAVSFTLNNSLIGANDNVVATPMGTGSGNYICNIQGGAAGSVNIRVTNVAGSPLTDALVINFAIIKGATS